MTDDEAGKLIYDAAQRIAQFDEIDLRRGNMPPSHSNDLHAVLPAIREAILAGLRTGDWSCVADGFVMLDSACGKFARVGKAKRDDGWPWTSFLAPQESPTKV